MVERTVASPLEGTGYERLLFDIPPQLRAEADRPGGLEPVVHELFRNQTASWPMLENNLAGLAILETSTLPMGLDNVVVQFNAGRARRTSGAKGEVSGCFLDAERLPLEQRGIAYSGLFVATNPFPILREHLTGIYPEHTNQSIDRLLGPALKLAEGLGKRYAVFYNGPVAGASAPKHAHIQAVREDRLPVETTLDKMDRSHLRREDGKSILYLPQALGRTVLAIESQDTMHAEAAVRAVIERLPVESGEYEPRMNLLVRAMGDGAIRTLIAPRTASVVELSHAGHSVLHPASLESIGGIVVVSSVLDYTHLAGSPEEITHIFKATGLGKPATREYLRDLSLAA